MKKDLVILVPDKNTQYAIKGAFGRQSALGVRNFSFEFLVHSGRDGGVRANGEQLLEIARPKYSHALLVLDFEGSGAENRSAPDLEQELDIRLAKIWNNAAKAIVISPEVDVWMWGGDNALRQVLQWTESYSIRDWLRTSNFNFDDADKPVRPKEALERVCRQLRLPRSASIYEQIAMRISLTKCTDSAFKKVRDTLQSWFSDGKVI